MGEYSADVSDEEKDITDDQDVIIDNDVWIGANVTILKGVLGKRIGERFTNCELVVYKEKLK